ncbi:MAG TPA: hypothetical protein VJ550_04330 [Geomonas sp.]|nr:hypothetical protein [Geomonas sp.]
MHLPLNIQMILVVVHAWDRGDRPDVDALSTVSALSRLQEGLPGRSAVLHRAPLAKSASLALY